MLAAFLSVGLGEYTEINHRLLRIHRPKFKYVFQWFREYLFLMELGRDINKRAFKNKYINTFLSPVLRHLQ
jgi:hypothetical protein